MCVKLAHLWETDIAETRDTRYMEKVDCYFLLPEDSGVFSTARFAFQEMNMELT